MSESEHREQQSELCNGGNGDDDDDEEDKEEQGDGGDGGNGDGGGSRVEERRREVNGEGVFRKAIMLSFRRTKKSRNRKETGRDDGENIELPSCTSSSSMAAARRGMRSECGGGCYICFMRPRTKESPDTPTSDPNSESFSSEMLRTLMERNDFYSKECNPHI